MKKIKLIGSMLMLATTLAITLASPPKAQAQQYRGDPFPSLTGSTVLSGGTNTVPALATNSYYIPLTKWGDVVLDLSFKAHTASSTSNLVFNIWESSDTNKPTSAARYTIAVAANSTTVVRPAATNFTVNAVGYFIVEVANTNASGVMTNVTGKYFTKPRRFGN